MINSSAVATVFTVYAVGVVIPGPNFVAVVHRAVSGTRSDALALVAGIVAVNLFWATCAILGIGVIFKDFPVARCRRQACGCGLSRLVWAAAHCKGSSKRHHRSAASGSPAVSRSVSSRCCDKYCESEIHRFLCSSVFLSRTRTRIHGDLLRHACYSGCNWDVLVWHSRTRLITRRNRDGVSSRESLDRPRMRWAHRRIGNSASASLTSAGQSPSEWPFLT